MTLYNDDCFKVLQELPENSVDFILTDPPYELQLCGRATGFMKDRDKTKYWEKNNYGSIELREDMAGITSGFDMPLFLQLAKRVLKKMHLLAFCSEMQVIKYLQWAVLNGYLYNIGAWGKTNPTPFCNSKYLGDMEYFVHIRERGVYMSSLFADSSKFYVSATNPDADHPTAKPLEFIKRLVRKNTKKEHVILDPFMGSGTTGIACKHLGREFIGIEIKKKYYDVARWRIEGIMPEEIKNEAKNLFAV